MSITTFPREHDITRKKYPLHEQECNYKSIGMFDILQKALFFFFQAGSQVDFTFPEKTEEIHEHQDSKDKTIVCPVEGQACIAKHKSGNWYRAQIIGEVLILSL